MEELGKIHQLIVTVSDYKMTFNLDIMAMTWLVIIGLLIFGYFAARKQQMIPGTLQTIGEAFVFQFYSLTEDALGEDMAKTYGPIIIALFMFLLFCNWIGFIPHLYEPTNDLNTPLSLGLMGFVIAHYAGIRQKGFKKYIKAYFDPIFFMAPLNIIGEISKVISISFRLFGNIMGGTIIVLVVSHLVFSLVLPPFLNAFFVIFIGGIQAFVFTMLTLVYIAVQVN